MFFKKLWRHRGARAGFATGTAFSAFVGIVALWALFIGDAHMARFHAEIAVSLEVMTVIMTVVIGTAFPRV
jgi:hypothetical protein